MNKVSVFHIGPQKSGTSWLYKALKEHPGVGTPETDAIHFFNVFYYKGVDWYQDRYSTCSDKNNKLLFDPSPSYIRDKLAPQRIYDYNPHAKILLTARNPLERAFSHYWHEKKKDRFNFCFREALENYDLFVNWIEPGLYATNYRSYLEYFPSEQIKILFFDDLETSPEHFFKEICDFLNIDSSFKPSTLEKKVNVAGRFKSYKQRQLEKRFRKLPLYKQLIKLKDKLALGSKPKESLQDVEADIKNQLIDVFYNDICELETITGRNLYDWKQKF